VVKKRFSLVKRRDRSCDGKAIYYCRFRSLSGDLLLWKSTGATSKDDAENWWMPNSKYLARKATGYTAGESAATATVESTTSFAGHRRLPSPR